MIIQATQLKPGHRIKDPIGTTNTYHRVVETRQLSITVQVRVEPNPDCPTITPSATA